ncbi:hypothetical protein QBC43DRAFT_380021 [Cladorrhinum sp. PSN259]|nr:hypothetical protein QBC43DRAFT_380021 [Cladorrhinum sp. PSN259]
MRASASGLNPPFSQKDELTDAWDHDTVPGHPTIPISDRRAVYNFLTEELRSHELEAISERLWWMSKVDSRNISPLHRQFVKRRNIVVTEEAKLHLVWTQDQIFIKPIPEYLVSYDFWSSFLQGAGVTNGDTEVEHTNLRQAALGFLRTYFHLIKHKSDFRIAQRSEIALVPENVSWERFCRFSAAFGSIQDHEVSGRYRFGEIRLSRLNFYAPLLLNKSYFHRVHRNYAQYFGRFYLPIITGLSFLSVVLSSMQIAAQYASTTPAEGASGLPSWATSLFLQFSMATMILVVVVLVGLALLWSYECINRSRISVERSWECINRS